MSNQHFLDHEYLSLTASDYFFTLLVCEKHRNTILNVIDRSANVNHYQL